MNNILFSQDFETVILANGAFPQHSIPLFCLHQAKRIICCDGATESLLKYGMQPDFIVGDLDSLSEELKEEYATILHHNPDQETNDLTKAVSFCVENHWSRITILGATGKREDHSLANISLLADYCRLAQIQMLTDYGVFIPILQTTSFESFQGQQVSLFSLTPSSFVSSKNLTYPLEKRNLRSWWQGTLNESLGDQFTIEIDKGEILVFREYKN